MKIICVVGARPNFVKLAPLYRAFRSHPTIHAQIVHTGQHYDASMSDVFFQQFHLPQPDYDLRISPGTATRQTADILAKFEAVLSQEQPDWVVVIGDVTSTFACALAAAQMGIRVAHVEAGLRSGDDQMPEERNRRLTDALSDLLFVTEQAGLDNLQREGVSPEKIHFVGNVVIDSLVHFRPKAAELTTLWPLGVRPKTYALVTIHRASNVDTEVGLRALVQLVECTALLCPVLFPLHPRTRANLLKFGLSDQLMNIPNVHILEPQGYLEFLNLMEHAAVVITDSGGIQEETTYLRVPCLTFRQSTERPVTVELGTNQLIDDLNPETAKRKVIEILASHSKISQIPPLWDGQTAHRITKIMLDTE